MSDPWAAYPVAEPAPTKLATATKPAASAPDPWATYQVAADAKPATQVTAPRNRIPGTLAPVPVTGAAHDGDTFALSDGSNGRLSGVDAFELNQSARSPSGALVPLGTMARARARVFLPGALAIPTGASTYGRPVVTINGSNGDPGAALLHDGLAVAEPKYLAGDPIRLTDYVQAERLARLNRRGAFGDTYQTPSSFRHGGVNPVTSPVEAQQNQSNDAIFWDDPTPYAGLPKNVADGYIALTTDLNSTPDQILGYAKANGFELDPKTVQKFVVDRAKVGKASSELTYLSKPRVLTDMKDGAVGAGLRGVADPFNVLDETGAIVDTLVPGSERENVWRSDRRFGDIYANNLEQNRDILGFDDAEHPWARFGGQMVGGLVVPGASVEGVGFAAARDILRAGGTRMAAEAAARRAVVGRLATSGAVEGAAAGAGQGENWQDRATGALIGAPAGAALGGLTGVAAPKVAAIVGKPFSKLAGREGEASAQSFTDGALDAGKAGAQNAAQSPAAPLSGAPRAATVIDTAALHAASADASGAVDMAKAGTVLRQAADEAIARGDAVTLHVEGKAIPITKPGMMDDQGQFLGAMPILTPKPGENPRLEITPSASSRVQEPASASMRGEPNPSVVGPDIGAPGPAGARPRPMSDPATDAERAAQAARIRPGDVLPLPSNAVDGVDEAARITAGRYDPVRAPNERDALEARNIPSPIDGTRTIPKRGPLDLVTWLRTQGGIRPHGGELEHLGIDNAARDLDFARGEGRFGKLVSKDGMGYDDAAHAAWERGYFPDHTERPTIPEFLDALAATHTGRNRSYLPDDFAEVGAFDAARRQRWDVEKAQLDGAPLVNDRGEPVDMADLDRNNPPVEAYHEWGENAPNLAGNIRLDKLDSPQAIKRALVETDKRVGGFDAATRGRITHAETEALASDLGMTADDLLKRRKGEAFNAEQALAARQILSRSGTDLINLARRVQRTDNPGDELAAAFSEAWLRHVAIQEQIAGVTAEAGRVLQQFRMTAESSAVDRVLPSLSDLTGGSGKVKEVADAIIEMEKVGTTPGGIAQYAAKALKPSWRSKLTELRMNFLLSGPQTHAVNMLSNTITSLGQIPEHAIAAGIGVTRQGVAKALGVETDADRVLGSEVGARAVGLLQGFKEGMERAGTTLRTGETADVVSKVELKRQNAISGRKGEIIRLPSRLLTAEDELFKGIAQRMELNGLAVRQAHAEGLRGGKAKERIAALISNPPDAMLARSMEYARYLTYNQALPHNGITAKIAQATNADTLGGLALKLVFPFTRTPVNIVKFAAERSPAALLMKSFYADINAGGARRDLALAKMMAGSGLMATAMVWAAHGHITGGGPADENAKRLLQADGWQPYSIRLGDRYYSYARLDPLATTLGVAADFAELQSHMTDKQKEHTAALLVTATAKNLGDKVWFSGATDLVQAVNDYARYGESYRNRMIASFAVPTVSAQVAREVDPTLRETRTMLDTIKARIPFASKSLPPRRDVWGQPVQTGGSVGPDIASPIWTRDRKNDPVNSALLAEGVGVGKPQRPKTMTDAEYDQLLAIRGMKSHSDLTDLIQSGDWSRMTHEQRAGAVKKITSGAGKFAKGAIPGALAPASDPWAAYAVMQ